MGAVLQTVNVRLCPSRSPTPLTTPARRPCSSRRVRRIDQGAEASSDRCGAARRDVGPPGSRDGRLAVRRGYESLIAAASPHYDFADFDENTQATTFYTTGTTGRVLQPSAAHAAYAVGARVRGARGKAGPFLARRRLYADHADVPCPLVGLSLGGDARGRQAGLSGTLRACAASQAHQDGRRHVHPRRAHHPADAARRRSRRQDGPQGIEDGDRRLGSAEGARQAGARSGRRHFRSLRHVGDRADHLRLPDQDGRPRRRPGRGRRYSRKSRNHGPAGRLAHRRSGDERRRARRQGQRRDRAARSVADAGLFQRSGRIGAPVGWRLPAYERRGRGDAGGLCPRSPIASRT